MIGCDTSNNGDGNIQYVMTLDRPAEIRLIATVALHARTCFVHTWHDMPGRTCSYIHASVHTRWLVLKMGGSPNQTELA